LARHDTGKGEAFEFTRDELAVIADELGTDLPKNVGDLIYSFRYRNELPSVILDTAKDDLECIIEGAGRARYRFRLVKLNRILPREELLTIKMPDATPEIISAMHSATSKPCSVKPVFCAELCELGIRQIARGGSQQALHALGCGVKPQQPMDGQQVG